MRTLIYPNKNITTYEFWEGSRVVRAHKDVCTPFYWWNLYVNDGEDITLTRGKAKTLAGVTKQAEKALRR